MSITPRFQWGFFRIWTLIEISPLIVLGPNFAAALEAFYPWYTNKKTKPCRWRVPEKFWIVFLQDRRLDLEPPVHIHSLPPWSDVFNKWSYLPHLQAITLKTSIGRLMSMISISWLDLIWSYGDIHEVGQVRHLTRAIQSRKQALEIPSSFGIEMVWRRSRGGLILLTGYAELPK